MALSPGDPNSHSRPDIHRSLSLHFDWDIDFQESKVRGETTIKFQRDKDDQKLLLDLNTLDIEWVQYSDDEDSSKKKLPFTVGPHGCCGSKLEVSLPASSSSPQFSLTIRHTSNPESPALLWMDKEQTSGKSHPFVFSQGQAILNRALFPCQDSPAVKTPYTATVRAPSELLVLMSALTIGEPSEVSPGIMEYKFEQKVPIPSYLVAFAAGKLESREIGPRSYVFAEEEYIDKAAFDFSETEDKLKVAEDICGPYLWGRYDILVLPPSFAYGGMENPCLTFVTPTLLTGDKSNSDVIAHEITHSWTGNLITNSNFEHFWLNEGFTVFIERKIKGRLKGEKERHFTTQLRWNELLECVNQEFHPEHEYTKLVPNLTGIDPDDAFCRVPYEKGSTFLWYLEELVGGAEKFEPFLKAYFKKFVYKSLDTDEFKTYFLAYFTDTDAVSSIDWNTWLYKPGMPPYQPNFDKTLAEEAWTLADKWVYWDKNEVNHDNKKSSIIKHSFILLGE